MTTAATPIRRALISVSDKTGLAEFAAALGARGVGLISTGGTAAALREAGLAVTDVSAVTDFPEMMGGRVKTLHPKIHGGLLYDRGDAGHVADAEGAGIGPIDLLVVNLYPFEATLAAGADDATCVENIDIGGPAMIRAAAKNHAHVLTVVEPGDYGAVLKALDAHDGAAPLSLRRAMAAKAFARTAAYDAAIATWMQSAFAAAGDAPAPERAALAGEKAMDLRYGENPHQRAAFYRVGAGGPSVATASLKQGKPLSYNNIADTDAAFELAAELDRFEQPACVIVKHANPCGAALGATLAAAYDKALACDPVSAFGGIIALNRQLDAETATRIAAIFTEVVIAPGASPDALEIMAAKPNLRLMTTEGMPDPAASQRMIKPVSGGFLLQDRDAAWTAPSALRIVTKRAPTPTERDDMMLAWVIAKHVKSNAIVYVKDRAAVGVGAGQMSRVDSARIAAWKAREAAENAGLAAPLTAGSAVASDAFFPFADGLEAAAAAGATAVIQPGGSVRDDEVIAAADKAGLAMAFTGIRHFRH